MRVRAAFFAGALGLAWASAARAQTPAAPAPAPVQSPHGAIRIACAECHSAEGWTPAHVSASFNHATFGFALSGAHAAASCRACHAKLDFTGTPATCATCHADPHRGEVGADCAHCHTTRSFLDRSVMMAAHQLTAFPLTGAHRLADCEACHAPAPAGRMSFLGRPTDCVQCHQSDYRATRDPDHVAGAFPTHCVECHNTASWNGATFNHQATRFPLTGAHVTVACNVCHADGVYAGKSTACASCHRADYDATADPAHAAAGFPLTCEQCHNTSTWAGARFDHDGLYFPIYSGAHAGRWASCATCHVNPGDYRVFDCLSCHEHDQSTMDSKHQGISGYSYTSSACYRCHPRGSGGD